MFAIALTLLVLDIRLPHPMSAAPADMWSALGDVQPQLVAFLVAFALLGRYWLAHHVFVSGLAAVTRRLMGLNLVYLAFLALLPFPTSLVGGNEENPVSVVVFASVLAAISAKETVLFVEARRGDLLIDRLDDGGYRSTFIGSLGPVVMFALTTPFAFPSPTWTLVSWILGDRPGQVDRTTSTGEHHELQERRPDEQQQQHHDHDGGHAPHRLPSPWSRLSPRSTRVAPGSPTGRSPCDPASPTDSTTSSPTASEVSSAADPWLATSANNP